MGNILFKKFILILFFIICINIFAQTFLEQAEVYYFNGKNAFQTQDFKSAEKFFEEALKLSSQIEIKYPDIRYMLGWAKFNLKKYDEAEKYLKYFTDDPKVKIALESIKSGNIQEDLHFESLKVKSTISPTKTSNENIKIGIFYYIIVSFVILFIIAILASLFYFFILKKYSFINKANQETSDELDFQEEELEEVSSIPMEEIFEVKIDELEELWEEYENMKNKMDVTEEEEITEIKEVQPNQSMETTIEELNVDEILNEEDLKTDDLNIDIEDVLEVENEENLNPKSEINENEESNSVENVEEEEEEEKKPEFEEDKIENLDNIETIKPNIDVITKYNKIMNEPEGSIVVSNINGLKSLDKIDEEIAKKGGQYSKVELHSIFKEIFAEKNRDSIMLE